MSDKQPRPIDRLDAAHAALEAAKAEYAEALAVLEADHELSGASQWRTDRITVSIGTRRHVDTAAFVRWVQEHRPDETHPADPTDTPGEPPQAAPLARVTCRGHLPGPPVWPLPCVGACPSC